jgi:phosphoribosylaminoimidazolecarboxamide formyltransferase/IMP cyclohydrolase
VSVRRALISVHDKTGIVDFARALAKRDVEILSTGGTARTLREAGVTVRDVADVTGFPEMLDGRVKTLHPRIHGAVLARRDVPEHLATLERHGIPPIDLVVVSLYPFEATVAKPGVSRADAIEQIDVGGPTMIRAAAKNHDAVTVVTDPSQYARVIDEITERGDVSAATRAELAREAFRRTAEYDAAIARYLAGDARDGGGQFPPRLELRGTRALDLRYGENPHQSAAFYQLEGAAATGLTAMRQLHGPELGYHNVLDFSAALGLLREFSDPAAVVIKHTNPCGAAVADTVGVAMARARAADPVSIYGGIVGVNRTLDLPVVAELAGIFVEILFAPAFAPEALEELRRTKKKARIFEIPCDGGDRSAPVTEYRSVLGGLLAQSADTADLDEGALRTVSNRAPTDEERAALRFAWRVAKHSKSNAIVLAARDRVIGVGAGQMNRVDSARIAVMRARALGLPTQGTVCASDAFFPFRDALDVVAEAGATAVIHPGGSLRDDEVLAAANEHGMAMLVTGLRHFRH